MCLNFFSFHCKLILINSKSYKSTVYILVKNTMFLLNKSNKQKKRVRNSKKNIAPIKLKRLRKESYTTKIPFLPIKYAFHNVYYWVNGNTLSNLMYPFLLYVSASLLLTKFNRFFFSLSALGCLLKYLYRMCDSLLTCKHNT